MIENLFSLNHCTALVTGGAGYLGKEICIGLANAGAHVIVQGRNEQKINEVIAIIEQTGGTAEAAIFDLLDEQATVDYFEQRKLPKLNILVNNAYKGKGGTITHSEDCDYRDSYEIGVIAVQRLFKICIPLFINGNKANKVASCINIASMYGHVVPDLDIYIEPQGANPPFYGACKAALIHWSKYAANQFGKQGIRVNCISPGPFPNIEVQNSAKVFISKLGDKVPLNRVGQSSELQGAVIFLASNASSYVTGINLQVDGGWACQ